MTIFDKSKLENRTWIEQINALFRMGKELEEEQTRGVSKEYVDEQVATREPKITTTNKLPTSKISGLGEVATTNDYNDLDNLPNIPSIDNLQTKLSYVNAGPNITITGTGDNVRISATGELVNTVQWGAIIGTITDQGDLVGALADKQNTLENGDGTEIDGNAVNIVYDSSTIRVNDDNELYVDSTALPTASSTTRGMLTSTDWNTFNEKQDALTPSVDYVVPATLENYATTTALTSNLALKQKKISYGTEEPEVAVLNPDEFDVYIKVIQE